MNEQSKNFDGYSLEDIRKYFHGDLSAAEMHAIESAALDDPFLAEAMEGYEEKVQTGAITLNNDLEDLERRLAAKTKRSHVGWWKIAAAVALIVMGVTIATLLINRTAKEPKIVQNNAALDEKAVSKPEESPQATAPAIIPAPSAEQNTSTPPANKKSRANLDDLKSLTDSGPNTFPNALGSINKTSPNESTSVRVERETEILQTDSLAPTLQSKVPGAAAAQDAPLEEVVVTGYSANHKRSKGHTQKSVSRRRPKNVSPAGGWNAFDNFIQQNKRIQGSDSLLTGNEIIQFSIDESGRPNKFLIRKSLSIQHDKEVTRLLEAGPEWIVTQGAGRRVKLNIIF